MKIKFDKNTNEHRDVKDLIIIAGHKVIKEMIASCKDGTNEITMHVNGIELDVERYVNRWQEQVDRAIAKQAEELIRSKFCDLDDSIREVESVVNNFETEVATIIKEKCKALNAGDNNESD